MGASWRRTPGGEPSEWKPMIAEGKNVIDSFSVVGGKLFVSRLKDVKTETTIYRLEGSRRDGDISRYRDWIGGLRASGTGGRVLHLRVVYQATDDLSLRHENR